MSAPGRKSARGQQQASPASMPSAAAKRPQQTARWPAVLPLRRCMRNTSSAASAGGLALWGTCSPRASGSGSANALECSVSSAAPWAMLARRAAVESSEASWCTSSVMSASVASAPRCASAWASSRYGMTLRAYEASEAARKESICALAVCALAERSRPCAAKDSRPAEATKPPAAKRSAMSGMGQRRAMPHRWAGLSRLAAAADAPAAPLAPPRT